MSTVRYGDYQGEVEYDCGKLVLRILHINDLITAEVDNASEVEAAFAELVDDYLASCAELGREPDRPFKGLFNVRVPPDLHKKAAFAAASEAVTLNAYVTTALENKLASPISVGDKKERVHAASDLAGFLRLSLVTCPVRLHPAAEAEHDLDSLGVIEIERFVAKNEIDPVYLSNSYFLVPDGVVGHDAYAVIRETIAATKTVGLARVGEHAIAIEPRATGMVATILRKVDQVRDPSDLFQQIQNVKVTEDMIDLAKHIVQSMTTTFDPHKFGQVRKKREKAPEKEPKRPRFRAGGNVIDLMEALRRSIRRERPTKRNAGAPRRKA